MASIWGDLLRGVGLSTVHGLGTAEEQRTRADRRAQLAEYAATRRMLAEAHYGNVDITDAINAARKSRGEEPLTTRVLVPRPSASQILGHVWTQPKVDMGMTMQDLWRSGYVQPPSMTTDTPVETPSEFGPPEYKAPAEMPQAGVMVRPDVAGIQELGKKRPGPSVLEYMRERQKQQTEGAKEAKIEAKQTDIGRARARLKEVPLETVLEEFPRLMAKDVLGSEPASPDRPHEFQDPDTAEIVRTTPGQPGVTTLRGPQRPSLRLQTWERRRDQQKAEAGAENLEALMAEGKPIPRKQAQTVVDMLNRTADGYNRDAKAEVTDLSQRPLLQGMAREFRARAGRISQYVSGKREPAETTVPGGTPLERVMKKWVE